MEDIEGSTARDAEKDEVQAGGLDAEVSSPHLGDLLLSSLHEQVEQANQDFVPKGRKL